MKMQIMDKLQRRLSNLVVEAGETRKREPDEPQSSESEPTEVDEYDAVQTKLKKMEEEGYNLEAMRLKIQWEARRLITAGGYDPEKREIERLCDNRGRLKARQDKKDYI